MENVQAVTVDINSLKTVNVLLQEASLVEEMTTIVRFMDTLTVIKSGIGAKRMDVKRFVSSVIRDSILIKIINVRHCQEIVWLQTRMVCAQNAMKSFSLRMVPVSLFPIIVHNTVT